MADGDDNFPLLPHRKNDVYDLNSKILLTAIISLSVVVLLVIVLHIYARCVLRRQASRRRQAFLGRIRSIGLTTSGGNQQLQPNSGLDPTVINSLPMFIFKQSSDVNRCNEDDLSKDCAVCLSMLEEEEMVRLLPNCKHTFHAECIDKWLSSQSTCPICRMEAEPRRLLPEPREGPAMEDIDSAAAMAESHSRERGEAMEGTSNIGDGAQLSPSAKVNNGSSSRMTSFRRILSRERSIRRVQSCEADDQGGIQDVERQ